MIVVGLDIGYSNLKVATGRRGEAPRVVLRPAGAAPLDKLGVRIQEGATGRGDAPIRVEVGGQPWVAGVEPGRFEGWSRSLHEDYATTPAYQALAKAGLTLAGYRSIDRVVTGLPVAQAAEPKRRDALMRTLVGRHVTAAGDIEVGEVRIVAQPIGAYVDLVWSATDPQVLERIEEGAVLVLDAGYYSFDWALVSAGALRRSASGTSLEAMSVLLEHAARRLAAQAGGKPNPAGLEAALRTGKTTISQAGRRVRLADLLAQTAPEVTAVALESLRQALRREVAGVDLVVLAGGGGTLYGAGLRDLFPGALTVVPEAPVAANARGFFHHGQ